MNFLLLLTKEDQPYYHRLQSSIEGHKAKVFFGKFETVAHLDQVCKKAGLDAVATTQVELLHKLLSLNKIKKASLSNYAGSVFTTPGGRDIVFLNPLKQLQSISYGQWLADIYLSKILRKATWRVASEFKYKILANEREYREFKHQARYAYIISIDIETAPPNIIRCISYTLALPDGTSHTGVFKLDSMDKVRWMRELNSTPNPKLCQNGKYECAHFYAYSAPMRNYILDTINAAHATYAELPKDLNFISSLYNRTHMYWKDIGTEAGDENLLHYNALDTWQTLEAFLSWLDRAPEYAYQNYVKEFTQVPIAHLMEMRGLKRDMRRLYRIQAVKSATLDKDLASIRVMVRLPNFNPSSPVQTLALLHALGNKDAESSDEATLQKCLPRHPINARILQKILDYRGERKLLSTYLTIGEQSKEYKGRILSAFNPHGTDTGRYASKSHHFWCGLQLQNIPGQATEVKNTLVADPGFEFIEADYRQAEARGVGYCSGDANLLEAVNSVRDFHSVNAASFFGIPYEDIYRDAVEGYIDGETGLWVDEVHAKTINKLIRDLAKRVNHGANYNMGAFVMLTTMGEKMVREARTLLKLPSKLSLIGVCELLLDRYMMTYPRVKTAYYTWIKNRVRATKLLVGATGWTRYCFGDPSANKMDLNSYVAHVTQSLNAMILNEAVKRIFLWVREENLWNVVKLNAQIHDSVLAQIPIGRKDLAEKLRSLMEFSVPVTDCIGVTRDMLVPVDLKYCGRRWERYK